MKIKKLTLNNFMAFEKAEINWSDNINIICGENSTGKTTLLKVMYSLIKPLGSGGKDNLTKEMEEQVYVKKIQGVFRPDEMKIGRLVSRKQGSNRTDFSIDLEKKQKISVGFGNRQENHADVSIERDEKIKKYDSYHRKGYQHQYPRHGLNRLALFEYYYNYRTCHYKEVQQHYNPEHYIGKHTCIDLTPQR